MARPATRLGNHGRVSYSTAAGGKVRARTRVKDFDGKLRLVQRNGGSEDEALQNLLDALRERQAPADLELTRDSKVSALAEHWWAETEAEGRLSASSLSRYRYNLDKYVLPRIGELQLGQATTGRLRQFLSTLAKDSGQATAKSTQAVIRHLFQHAVELDALSNNPASADKLKNVRVDQKAVKALSLEDVQALRAAAEGDVLDVLDLLLATGARIGEVLALRWADVDLDARTVAIRRTVITPGGRPALQDHPKNRKSTRVLTLPRFGVEALQRRRRWAPLVFPNERGGVMDPNNYRRRFKKAVSAAGLEDVSPHAVRRTVATMIAREVAPAAATGQLGHASEKITVERYIERLQEAPDLSSTLEVFAAVRDE